MSSVRELIPLDFDDAKPHYEPVSIGGVVKYFLHEALEGDAVVYHSARGRAAKMEDGKVVGVVDIGEVSPLLVSLCLYHSVNGEMPVLPDGSPDIRRRVTVGTIKKMPSKMIKKLFERAKLISELTDEDEETEESLVKDIDDRQKRLAKLREGKSESAAKNGQEPTDPPSEQVES